jgi:hypothetical protein
MQKTSGAGWADGPWATGAGRGKKEKGRRRKGKGVGCLEAFSPKRFREQEILFHFSNPFYNLQTNFNSNQI